MSVYDAAICSPREALQKKLTAWEKMAARAEKEPKNKHCQEAKAILETIKSVDDMRNAGWGVAILTNVEVGIEECIAGEPDHTGHVNVKLTSLDLWETVPDNWAESCGVVQDEEFLD